MELLPRIRIRRAKARRTVALLTVNAYISGPAASRQSQPVGRRKECRSLLHVALRNGERAVSVGRGNRIG